MSIDSSESNDEPQMSDTITESLLSLAKDTRYVQQCQELLQQTIDPILSGRSSESHSEWTKGTWFISYVLYTLVVVAPSGRTLGMQASGLTFSGTSNRRRLVISLLAFTFAASALDRFATTRTNIHDPDMLRGEDRRSRHEQLRLQMLQRAASGRSSVEASFSSNREASGPSVSYRERLVSNLRKVSKSILTAISDTEGPHQSQSSQANSSTFSVAMWVLRLHLAQYCITGKYPTILHRLLGLEHEPQESRIPVRPNTNRIIALLIGVQASATLTQRLVHWWTRKVASYLESRSSPPSLTSIFPMSKPVASPKSQSTCSICRMARSHPAAPSSCGHVFCWNCLIQWVSTVRAECPLCRAACRPQDILPLYNYEQPPLQQET